MTMNGVITGIDKLADGALKLYIQGTDNAENWTEIKKADGSLYTTRIGKQTFDVFLSQSSMARFATLGLNNQLIEAFYQKQIALPFARKSFNGKFYVSFDDFAMAALLISLKSNGKE